MLLDLFSVEFTIGVVDTHDFADWVKHRKPQERLLAKQQAEKLAYAEELKQQIKDIIHPKHEVQIEVIEPTKPQIEPIKFKKAELSLLHRKLDKVENELKLLQREMQRRVREDDDIHVILLVWH